MLHIFLKIQTLTADIAHPRSLAICKSNWNHSVHVNPTFMDSVFYEPKKQNLRRSVRDMKQLS